VTVQTQFHDWGSNPMQPDPRSCSPLNTTYTSYLLGRWGGQNLGCYASRPVVGGTTLSTHASGAANDWRYENPGIGRTRMLNEVMPWLLNNSREIGLQAVHDYVGCRIWRPPGTSGRPSTPSPECGWRQQNPGSQMGQSWALWLHLEVLNTRWSDTRTIDEMLGSGGGGVEPEPPPTPEPEPEPEPEDDMTIVLLQASNGTKDQQNALFWWDGRQIGLVRATSQRDLGIVAGVYTGDSSNRPFRNCGASDLQRIINSSWAGGQVPNGYTAPPASSAPPTGFTN